MSTKETTEKTPVESGYLIRRMREEDLPQVMVIEGENFSIPWSLKSFQDMMRRPEAVFLVAERADTEHRDTGIVGYAGAVMALDEGDVTNIAVLGTYKKQGIATRLLKQLICETMAAGVRDLFLEVREHNTPALCLYRAAGFAEVGRRKGYYDQPKEDALIMKRSCPECKPVQPDAAQ